MLYLVKFYQENMQHFRRTFYNHLLSSFFEGDRNNELMYRTLEMYLENLC